MWFNPAVLRVRFYNRIEPQKTANIPRIPDRNQNLNLPSRPAKQPQLSADKNISRTAKYRVLNLVSGKWYKGITVHRTIAVAASLPLSRPLIRQVVHQVW